MADLKLIDCHIHCFRSEEDSRFFMSRVVRRPDAGVIGSVPQFEDVVSRAGIDHANILMFTPTSTYYGHGVEAIPAGDSDRAAAEEGVRHQVVARLERNNDWCAGFVRDRANLSFFCGIDPVRMSEVEILSGIERWVAAGARGVKIVLSNLRIFGNDRRLFPVYDYCQERELPLLTQSGGPPAPGHELAFAHPAPFGEVLPQFPNLRLVFAHMAYFPYLPDCGADALHQVVSRYPNVCTDLSLRLNPVAEGTEPVDWLVSSIRRLGADRVLFGTNFPLADPVQAVTVFDKLPLTDGDRELIAHKNFERLTGG